HTMPHVPLFASGKFKDTSARGLYGDVIEEMDWSVGQILATLKELDLDENTLVVYTSDNGPWLSKGAAGGSALPLRDGKFSTWEGGMREPCIMRWPSKIPAGTTCAEIGATIDLMPTFAKLAGAKVPDDRKIDGRDIWPLMAGEANATPPRDTYFFRTAAVRQGKWKLHLSGRDTVKKRPDQKFPALYDLSADIGEDNNVAAENPEVVERLTKLLKDHREDLKANSRPIGELEKK
ncbi:MAG: sulfatase-like hydrolase/transferase, partial [Thermoguttaceae bacterium]